jgi:O-antigen/teichoic acid export membrane protein
MTDLASSSEPGRPERRVAINSGLLLAAFGFQALVSIVMVGILARYLGQAGLGRYAYVVSFIELFLAFVDLGLNRILTREISRHKALADRYASAAWTLRLVLSVAAMIVVGVVAAASGDRELWLATMIYYASQVLWLLGDVFNGVFHGFQRMEYQFWTLNASQVLLLALTLGVIWLDLGLIAIFTARLLTNAIKLIWVWRISDRRFARVHMLWGIFPALAAVGAALPRVLATLRHNSALAEHSARSQAAATIDAQGQRLGQHWQDARLTWRIFAESLPVGISLLLRSYIWRAGVVLTVLWLGQAQGDLVNGVLYGPLRAIQQLRIVPAAFSAAMLPVFSNRAAHRMGEFDSAFGKSIKLFTAISLLIALAATFLADPLVLLLLGSGIDLQTAAMILALLGWVIVLYFPNWLYGVALVALGKQKLETLGLVIGLIVGYLVARWAIPTQQALGVAYAIMAAEGAIFVIGTAVLWRHFHWRTLGRSLVKLVAASTLAGAVFLAGNLGWSRLAAAGLAPIGALGAIVELIIVGGLGIAAFVAALFLLRTFDADEIEGIRAMLNLRPNR